ncbi:MAG: DUF1385 domain-containing protein [Thermanaerothrix sp.]|nr:DUF1385 domain-containing protein [Thermanaerothrix sp.]
MRGSVVLWSFLKWMAGLTVGVLKSPEVPLPVGGQAVIEGVLMRGYSSWGISIRTPEGSLWRERWGISSWTARSPWNWPVLRGFCSMVDMVREGYKGLSISASVSSQEEPSKLESLLSILIAVTAVVGLFLLLPLWLSETLGGRVHVKGVSLRLLEGIIRGAVFVAYLGLVGLWGDMRRVFAYHGAEHKTINAYESGAPMDVDSIKSFSRIHPRCGTSFLVVVILVSVVVFGLMGRGGLLWRISSRVILLPLVVGISYEIIKWASRGSVVGRALVFPALGLQFLTTREPSDDQIEVALDALRVALGPDVHLSPSTAGGETQVDQG